MRTLKPRAVETGFLILVCLLIFIPYFHVLTSGNYYVPGIDEIYQLQGARELFLGHGYLSSRNFTPQDLSSPILSYVNAWPIGYSFCISTLMKLGLSLSTAAKLFIAASISLGLGFWILLSEKFLTNLFHRSIFALILCTQLLSWMIYSTNCITWALFPLFLLMLLKAPEKKFHLISASILTSILILFRYQNLTFIPVGVLWLVLIAAKRKAFRSKPSEILRSLGFAAMPCFTYGAISYLNKLHTQGTSFLSVYKFSIYWDPKWLIEFVNAIFLGATYRIDSILLQLGTMLHQENLTFWIMGALSLTLFGITGLSYARLWKGGPESRTIPLLLIINLAALSAMFWSLAIFYGIDNIPIGRYYHFLAPLIILGVVKGLMPNSNKAEPLTTPKGFLLAITFLAALFLVGRYSTHRLEISRQFAAKSNTTLKLIEQVIRTDPQAPVFIITDYLLSTFVVDRYLPSVSDTALLDSPSVSASQATWLILATDKDPIKAEQYLKLTELEHFVASHKMSHLSDGSIDLYWKKLATGPLQSHF